MKLRKLISMAIATAIVMANAVIISAPTAYAAVEKAGTAYSQGFGNAAASYSNTLNGLKGQGWYAADNTQLYTNVSGSVQPYKATSGKFGQIVADPTGASNYCLKVCSAGELYGTYQGAVIKNYGYGTTFPGVEANQNVSGSWEISFYFIPNCNAENQPENAEFAFTVNTSAGPNNLVSSDGANMIIGSFNPTTASTPFSSAAMNKIPLQKATYRVKAFLNIDQGYYSVELWVGSTLVARRGPMTLNNANVKFLKFSALGISSACYVYVDNVSIKSAADSSSTLYADGRENLIYSDDFSAYSGSAKASVAMTNETSGTSFFAGKYTPWRAYSNKDTYGNYSVTDGVLKLGNQGNAEKSAMIYALPGETIVGATTERTRGMLNVSFKINPANIKANSGFYVTLGELPSSGTQTTVFTMGPTGDNKPKIMYPDGRPATVLNAEHWYTVDMTIDVINRAIKFVVTDDTNSGAVCAEYVQAPTSGNYMTPTSVGEIMFRAGDGGSYILLDDVNISYVTPVPSVDTSKIVMTDNYGDTISDTTDVTVSVASITVPLGTIANATVSNFTLVDDSSNTVTCTGTLNSGNTYTLGDTFTISPSTLLQSGKTYTLTVLTTLASVYGGTLASPATFTFTTTDAKQDLMCISAVKVDGTAASALSDITGGSTINVETRYANNTEDDITGVVIVAFYGNNKILKTLIENTTVAAGASGTDTTTFEFSVPSDVDMESVRGVSVFLWDGFENIIPYCAGTSFGSVQ